MNRMLTPYWEWSSLLTEPRVILGRTERDRLVVSPASHQLGPFLNYLVCRHFNSASKELVIIVLEVKVKGDPVGGTDNRDMPAILVKKVATVPANLAEGVVELSNLLILTQKVVSLVGRFRGSRLQESVKLVSWVERVVNSVISKKHYYIFLHQFSTFNSLSVEAEHY